MLLLTCTKVGIIRLANPKQENKAPKDASLRLTCGP